MGKPIKIITWNANGILQHREEFEHFPLTNNINVALVSETHLQTSQTVRLRGYMVCSTPHPSDRARGVAAVIIKFNITHHMLQPSATMGIQTSSVQVKHASVKVNMVAIYCSPNHTINSSIFRAILNSARP